MTAIVEPTTGRAAPESATRPVPDLPPVAPAAELAAAPPVRPAAPPAARPGGEPAARPGRERPVLSATGIRLLGLAMVALFVASVSLTPAADGPQPVLSPTEEIIATVVVWGMVATLAGFAAGRRWALWPALGVSGLSAFDVALCPVTGHHVVGAWWIAQAGIAVVLVLAPLLALARTRAG